MYDGTTHSPQVRETDLFFDIELDTDIDLDIDIPYSDETIAQSLNCDVIGQEANHSRCFPSTAS